MSQVITKLRAPKFSLEERDLHWGRVRRLMERDQLDVIVCPNFSGTWNGGNANNRYLSGIGGNNSCSAVIFPGTAK